MSMKLVTVKRVWLVLVLSLTVATAAQAQDEHADRARRVLAADHGDTVGIPASQLAQPSVGPVEVGLVEIVRIMG